MPRTKRRFQETPAPENSGLANLLAEELKQNHAAGQPLIDEQEFSSGQIRVTVYWDAWHHLSMEDRTAVILKAYALAETPSLLARIALASGLTIPEASAAGMLPYQILTALRREDSVDRDQCRQAMIDEGASTLLDDQRPQLRFARKEEAEAARQRLIDRLPGSDPVWLIARDLDNLAEWAN